MHTSFFVSKGVSAPAEARREMRARLGQTISARDVDDVELLLSEVVTNAVRHGTGRAMDPLAIRADIIDRSVTLEVEDSGGGSARVTPQPEPERDGDPHGFGLFLVDELSASWGVERCERGSYVWFQMDHDADSLRPSAAAIQDHCAPAT
jgi:anti-sigma regulatory factor (Ser/Thr protein kinase)